MCVCVCVCVYMYGFNKEEKQVFQYVPTGHTTRVCLHYYIRWRVECFVLCSEDGSCQMLKLPQPSYICMLIIPRMSYVDHSQLVIIHIPNLLFLNKLFELGPSTIAGPQTTTESASITSNCTNNPPPHCIMY